MQDPAINGTCDDRFVKVREAFARHFTTGEDIGACLAVFLDGKPVVDLWGGHADITRRRPWEEENIICVFSSTKVMAAICIHVLADRGLLDYDAPVANYWAEFGKANVLVRHVLSHTSGIVTYPEQVSVEDLCDWGKMVGLIERQEPLWEPGTKLGYEMTTFGYMTGEIVKRVAGKSIGTFFRDEIARPLGADFHIGLPEAETGRLVDLIPPRKALLYDVLNNDLAFRLLGRPTSLAIARNPKIPVPRIGEMSREPAWLHAEIPSSNGTGNARSMARIGAMVACGGEIDGVRLLSAGTIQRAATPQFKGSGCLLPVTAMGLGWSINIRKMANGKVPRTLSWAGLGGSFVAMDLDNRMSYAYAMNKMNMGLRDPRRKRLEDAIYASIA